MIVIIGMIDKSWNSRMAKARSPNGVRNRPDDCSIGSTCAVEESASGRPSASAAADENSVPSAIIAAMAMPQAVTCSSPSPRMSRFIFHRREGFSSSPTRNSSSVMPSSAMPSFCSASPTRPSTCGPTTAPATR